jgi:hypothetical protein
MEPGAVDLCGYDDVLLLGAGGVRHLDRLESGRLKLVTQSDVAALFQVGSAACGTPVAAR